MKVNPIGMMADGRIAAEMATAVGVGRDAMIRVAGLF